MESSPKYTIRLSSSAAKYYNKAPSNLRNRIDEALSAIAYNPFDGPHIMQLKGELKGKYRYRMGDIRIIYTIKQEILEVHVLTIGPRGDVYK